MRASEEAARAQAQAQAQAQAGHAAGAVRHLRRAWHQPPDLSGRRPLIAQHRVAQLPRSMDTARMDLKQVLNQGEVDQIKAIVDGALGRMREQLLGPIEASELRKSAPRAPKPAPKLRARAAKHKARKVEEPEPTRPSRRGKRSGSRSSAASLARTSRSQRVVAAAAAGTTPDAQLGDQLLKLLISQGTVGGLSMGALTEQTQLTRARVTRGLERLQSQGFVERRGSGAQTKYVPTKAGALAAHPGRRHLAGLHGARAGRGPCWQFSRGPRRDSVDD